jgi:hypothetical protein
MGQVKGPGPKDRAHASKAAGQTPSKEKPSGGVSGNG